MACGVLWRVGLGVGPAVERSMLACFEHGKDKETMNGARVESYVATMPPIVPRVTTQLLDTARTAEPPESKREERAC